MTASELEISVRRAIEPTTRAIVDRLARRDGGRLGRRALGTEAEVPTLPEGAEKTRARPSHGRARAERERGADPEIDAMADADDAHRAALARRAKSARREAPEAMVP